MKIEKLQCYYYWQSIHNRVILTKTVFYIIGHISPLNQQKKIMLHEEMEPLKLFALWHYFHYSKTDYNRLHTTI